MRRCVVCGRTRYLISDDGPVRCRICVWKAAHEAAEVEAVWKWMQDGVVSAHTVVRR